MQDDPVDPMSPHDHAACVSRVMAEVDQAAAGGGLNLTPVRRRVLEILLESHTALGAYDILKRLDAEGLGAQPPVAYRALDFLQTNGFVHKIERLNAFVACMHPGEGHNPAFMVCRSCRSVAEAHLSDESPVDAAARASGFRIERMMVEIEGLCPSCQDPAA